MIWDDFRSCKGGVCKFSAWETKINDCFKALQVCSKQVYRSISFSAKFFIKLKFRIICYHQVELSAMVRSHDSSRKLEVNFQVNFSIITSLILQNQRKKKSSQLQVIICIGIQKIKSEKKSGKQNWKTLMVWQPTKTVSCRKSKQCSTFLSATHIIFLQIPFVVVLSDFVGSLYIVNYL